MGFVKFTRTRVRLDKPMASIWKRGQIGFNQGAIEEFNLGQFTHVVLYYDGESNRVGFEFTNDKDTEGAMKLVFRKSSGASFSAVPFLKINKIDYTESKQYNFIIDKDAGFYVIDLSKPV
jgi:hypothetical protein